MAWLSAPTQLALYDGTQSLGVLVGTDAEAGYYAFQLNGGWVVSDSFYPEYVINGSARFRPTAYHYAGHPVWEGTNAGGFIFHSPTVGQYIYMSELREPSWIEPLAEGDVTTGDRFWKIGSMAFNTSGTASAGGAAAQDVPVSFVWRLWTPYSVRVQDDNEAMCGVYYNERAEGTESDPLFHVIGLPCFEVVSGPDAFFGETFVRDVEQDASEHDVFDGSRGHTIRYDTLYRVWRTGSFRNEEGELFWQSASKPVMKCGGSPSSARTTFSPMTFDENRNRIASGERPVVIRLKNIVIGSHKDHQLVGEVEVWR